MLTPYRLAAYGKFGEAFDTLILHGGTESNRTWTLEIPPSLKAQEVLTLQIMMRKRTGVANVLDNSYVHLNLGLLWWLPRFFPDVIVTHEMGIRTVIAIIYGKLARVPVWVWWGGTIHSERNITKARKFLRRLLVHHIQRWISYGVTTTEYLESIGVPRAQVLQVQNCVPQETFQIVPSKPPNSFNGFQQPVILTIGQLVQRKGFDKLIEACGRLTRRGTQYSLVIVGQGPELDRLKTLARENGIENFQILPNQPQSVLNEMYRSADVFVFPTLEDVWGLVVNEAMWAGTPVLCSKYAGCAKELLPESNIFDPLTTESFDRALSSIFDQSVCPPDRNKLLTWQQVSGLICSSLESGVPAR
jgi:glycosyltransferase involved in cell wall biosynthesis